MDKASGATWGQSSWLKLRKLRHRDGKGWSRSLGEVVAKKGTPISVPDLSSFHYIICLHQRKGTLPALQAGSDCQVYVESIFQVTKEAETSKVQLFLSP